MSRSRRQPPLFEALGGNAGDAARPADGRGPARPIVHVPLSTARNGSTHPAAPARSASPAPDHRPAASVQSALSGRLVPILLMGVAAIVLIAVAAWSWGYARGESAGENRVLRHTTPQEAAAITGQNPVGNPPAALPSESERVAVPEHIVTPPKPAPTTRTPAGMPPVTGPDPRQPGHNYLELVRLTWRDAQAAVVFLQKNGIPATCVPVGGVDPAKAQANNGNHLVFVLDGIPSGQYRASEAKRNELIARVRGLGKRWQREERGASDFGEPIWASFKGK